MRPGFRVLGGALMLGAWCVQGCGGTIRQSDASGGSDDAQGVSGHGGTAAGGTPVGNGGTAAGGTPVSNGGVASGDVPGAALPIDHTEVASCLKSASTNAPSITVTIYGDGSAERVIGPPRNLPVAAPMERFSEYRTKLRSPERAIVYRAAF